MIMMNAPQPFVYRCRNSPILLVLTPGPVDRDVDCSMLNLAMKQRSQEEAVWEAPFSRLVPSPLCNRGFCCYVWFYIVVVVCGCVCVVVLVGGCPQMWL